LRKNCFKVSYQVSAIELFLVGQRRDLGSPFLEEFVVELPELRLGFGELEEQGSVSRRQLNLEVKGCLGLRDELKAFYFFEPFFLQSLTHVVQWQLV